MSEPSPTERVARLFDELAPVYDKSGVEFFGPIATRLVDLLQVRTGERAVDIGCGRGAVTLRLAERVGPQGTVTAIDLSPAMVELTRAAAEHAGLRQVSVEVMDAMAPTLPQAGYDLIASSVVLFFLPDPVSALARWLRLLAPGGRIGVTTFGEQDEVWRAVDDLVTDYLPEGVLDPRTAGRQGPFANDAAMKALFVDAGATWVRSVNEPTHLAFESAAAWRQFSLSVGQRDMWPFVPERQRDELFAQIARLLEGARGPDGKIVLTQIVRYTLALVE
jgi:ubiquinone/menaquinone biosynthesis C-methylase UbiE